jgi:hypothetical protein
MAIEATDEENVMEFETPEEYVAEAISNLDNSIEYHWEDEVWTDAFSATFWDGIAAAATKRAAKFR